MFSNLAFHGKPAPAADSPQPQDRKALALTEIMKNWDIDSMSDVLPASIRPLDKNGSDAPGFAAPGDWSWNMVEKLQYVSRMTQGDAAWAHRVLEACVNDRQQGLKGITGPGKLVREVTPVDVKNAVEQIRFEKKMDGSK